MKISLNQTIFSPLLVLLGIIASNPVNAELVKLADKPLVNSGTSDVLPNIMFVLDNSGSMDFDQTPDWANPFDNFSQPVDSNASFMWSLKNSAYNTQYYNPSISYTPAVMYNGVSMGNQASPWTSVKNDVTDTGIAKGGTVNLVNKADYFAYVAGEHCTSADLFNCITSSTPTTTHPFPAPIRWCNSASAATAATVTPIPPNANSCRAIREGSFTNLRSPSAVTRITLSGNNNTSITSIKVDGKEILFEPTASNSTRSTVVNRIIANINECRDSLTGNCQTYGYSAIAVSGNSSALDIVSFWGSTDVSKTPIISKSGGMTVTVNAFTQRTPGRMEYVNIVSGDDTYTLPGKAKKAPDRVDCAGDVCTYAEEMTNYANWYTYYRTRMQAMKTAASIAFKAIDNRYRVGFITISNQANNYLPIATFESGANGQKSKWYKQLFATTPGGGTPLRSALSIVGRIYAGKKPVTSSIYPSMPSDPIEYSCQQNFTLLTTDGYWNTDSASSVRDINGNAIGNLDKSAPRPLYEGTVETSGSLADVAKYYYDTDIRDLEKFNNCNNGNAGSDVCGAVNDHIKQNMVTLTLGLGIDGTLLYSDDYKEQTTGDFANLKTTSANWSNPMLAENGTRIDDLWHAAVNAGGTYYSAKNPKLLRDSLVKGLSEIKSVFGAGSAAAASSLAPTSGDNYQFVASYRSGFWTGNLEARTVDINTLKTSETATWCAEPVVSDTCTLPATFKSVKVGTETKFYCETKSSTEEGCNDLGGSLGIGGTPDACYKEIKSTCEVGTMSKLDLATRKIYVNNGGILSNLTAEVLTADQQKAFADGYAALTQFSDFTLDQQNNPNKVQYLVNYIRGNNNYENRSSNPTPENRLFRPRTAILGDITQSKPAYLKKSPLSYVDPGYTTFRDSIGAARTATVFVGANDGMLHAFNAEDGMEMWAFIPSPVIKNLPKLADSLYSEKHVNYVNGNPYLADICIASCDTGSAQWRTILVGGLNGGGRGYYALDVTNPASPSLLWEFTSKDDSTLGYSFGEPVVTKLSSGSLSGKWVVLLTSGYNNGDYDSDGVTKNDPSGDGRGYLYILDAYTGKPVKAKMSNNTGNAGSPSGLAKISAYAADGFKNNLATYLYGGDLEGGLWRFDINNDNVVKVATLRDPSGTPQPITTAPQLGLVNKKRVIFVGTGKYLEEEDLIDKQVQSVYAIKDDDVSSELSGLRGGGLSMVTLSDNGEFRTASSVPENFTAGLGWMVDFPAGERVNVDPLLLNGVLLMPSTVPNSTSCLGGGFGWFNYFNYKTGGSPIIPGGVVSEKLNTPAVGFNILYDDKRKPVVSVVESNDPTPHHLKNKDVAANSDASRETVFDKYDDGTYGRRSIWRELIR